MRPRPENWPAMLAAHVERLRSLSFAWGKTDCVTVSADWMMTLGYDDPIADIRGRWRSATGASRVIGGADNFAAAVATRLAAAGCPEIAPAFAHRGDIALLREPAWLIPSGRHPRLLLGLVDGRMAWAPVASRFMPLPLSAAIAAWRI